MDQTSCQEAEVFRVLFPDPGNQPAYAALYSHPGGMVMGGYLRIDHFCDIELARPVQAEKDSLRCVMESHGVGCGAQGEQKFLNFVHTMYRFRRHQINHSFLVMCFDKILQFSEGKHHEDDISAGT